MVCSPFRVGDLGDLVQRVVLAANLRRHAAVVLQGLGQAVQRIELLAGHPLQCISHRLRVAVGIVGKAGSVIASILQRGQLAERVERPRQCTAQAPPVSSVSSLRRLPALSSV